MNQYRFTWKDGRSEILEGMTVADALNCAGYGAGALRALDYWSEITNPGYERLPEPATVDTEIP